mgnify:CR=1 FL=1
MCSSDLKRAAKGVDRIINIVLDLDLITQFESGIKIVDKKKDRKSVV